MQEEGKNLYLKLEGVRVGRRLGVPLVAGVVVKRRKERKGRCLPDLGGEEEGAGASWWPEVAGGGGGDAEARERESE